MPRLCVNAWTLPMLQIKTHPLTGHWLETVYLDDIWRPPEVHFRFPLNRWKSPPPGIRRVNDHNDRRSPSWQQTTSHSCFQTMCQGDGVFDAKAQSHATDSSARWEMVGVDEGEGRGDRGRSKKRGHVLYEWQWHNKHNWQENANAYTQTSLAKRKHFIHHKYDFYMLALIKKIGVW